MVRKGLRCPGRSDGGLDQRVGDAVKRSGGAGMRFRSRGLSKGLRERGEPRPVSQTKGH